MAAVSTESGDRDREDSGNSSNNNGSISDGGSYSSSNGDILNANSSSSAGDQNLVVSQSKYLFCLRYFNREII